MPRRAFTLVELLVVIAIIGLLSMIAVVSLSSVRMNARNTQRKANLIQIAKALELYYADHAGYPLTGSAFWGICNEGGNWTAKSDTGSGGWIPDLAPTYLAVLPHDPNENKVNPTSARGECTSAPSWSCYAYKSDGIDYKIVAACTPEGTLSLTDPFADPAPWGATIRGAYRWAVWTPGGASWQN